MTSSPGLTKTQGNDEPTSFGALLVMVGVATLLALLLGIVAPAVAQAATPTSTTFKISGTVAGTFTSNNNDCDQVGTYGGDFDFYTKLKGWGPTPENWSVSVNALGSRKGGTFHKFGGLLGNGVSLVMEGTKGNTAYDWISKSGTLTTSTASGSLNVVLGPDRSFSGKPGKGTLHLIGSWGCEASS